MSFRFKVENEAEVKNDFRMRFLSLSGQRKKMGDTYSLMFMKNAATHVRSFKGRLAESIRSRAHNEHVYKVTEFKHAINIDEGTEVPYSESTYLGGAQQLRTKKYFLLPFNISSRGIVESQQNAKHRPFSGTPTHQYQIRFNQKGGKVIKVGTQLYIIDKKSKDILAILKRSLRPISPNPYMDKAVTAELPKVAVQFLASVRKAVDGE